MRRASAPEAEQAAELAREVWRALEEFNLNPNLALEALFVRLQRHSAALAGLNREYWRSVKIPQRGLRDRRRGKG